MSNPFTFGTVVSGEDFANREKELNELGRRLKSNVRIFLVAPRRYGKTSLIQNALDLLQKERLLTAYLDLFWANSSKEFMELWVSNVIRGSRSISRRAARFVKDFLPRLRPKLSFDPTGNPQLSLDMGRHALAEAVDEVFHLPEKIAKAEKKRFVVVLDEFQEILRLNGEALERQLRAAIQQHRNVSYLFAGSKTRILIDMVSDPTRPFYQIGTLMSLDKIPEEEFRSFIEAKFVQSKKKISPAALDRLLQESENVPHYVQLLCFNLWDHFQGVSRLEEEHVEKALSITLRGQEPAFLTLWEGLTLNQRKTLQAVSLLEGRLLTAKDTIYRFDLESASNVARSLKALCSKGILRKETDGYVFEDVLFGKWIQYAPRHNVERSLSH
jgi:AAA+ ATPase superfamily predicted ATPase